MDGCQFRDDPKACLEEKRRRHLPLKYRRNIECDYCSYAYDNAVKAHVPEPDIEPHQRNARINPDDFLESRPVVRSEKRGRKPTTKCRKGHSYAKHGRKRNDGGYRCRICDAAKQLQRYHAKKAK